MMVRFMSPQLTKDQIDAYRRDGFIVVPGVFSHAECDGVVEHMLALAQGRKKLAGFPAIDTAAPKWGRTHNQHLYDPVAMAMLIDSRVMRLLAQATGGEADAVQSMYFWQGSQQRRHQDQYYLPGCFSAWCPLMDVGPDNGTIHVQVGSHRGPLITQADMKDAQGNARPLFGPHYDDAVDALFERNALPELPVVASKGSVVIFDGRLIHRGGPVGVPGSWRHVMANHYIPRAFTGWPYATWPRISSDSRRRCTAPGQC